MCESRWIQMVGVEECSASNGFGAWRASRGRLGLGVCRWLVAWKHICLSFPFPCPFFFSLGKAGLESKDRLSTIHMGGLERVLNCGHETFSLHASCFLWLERCRVLKDMLQSNKKGCGLKSC